MPKKKPAKPVAIGISLSGLPADHAPRGSRQIVDDEDEDDGTETPREAVVRECEESGGCGESPCLHGVLFDEEEKVEKLRKALAKLLVVCIAGGAEEHPAVVEARALFHATKPE